MVNLSLTDLMDYTDWERQKRHEWMRQQGDQVLRVSAGANGDRFETVGDLVKHIFFRGETLRGTACWTADDRHRFPS